MLKEQNTFKMIFAIVKIPYPQRHVRKESILDIFRNRKIFIFQRYSSFSEWNSRKIPLRTRTQNNKSSILTYIDIYWKVGLTMRKYFFSILSSDAQCGIKKTPNILAHVLLRIDLLRAVKFLLRKIQGRKNKTGVLNRQKQQAIAGENIICMEQGGV